MNQIEGVSFDEVWKNRLNEKIIYKGREIPVYFIGIDELIKNKRNINRPKDSEDLKYLLHLKKL
jgi:hypothetical protein